MVVGGSPLPNRYFLPSPPGVFPLVLLLPAVGPPVCALRIQVLNDRDTRDPGTDLNQLFVQRGVSP